MAEVPSRLHGRPRTKTALLTASRDASPAHRGSRSSAPHARAAFGRFGLGLGLALALALTGASALAQPDIVPEAPPPAVVAEPPPPALAPEPQPPRPVLAGPWRLRLDLGRATEFSNDLRYDDEFGIAVRISVDVVRAFALEFGFGLEGASVGLRLQHMTRRGWQFWGAGAGGFRGYTRFGSEPVETRWGLGAAVGTSLRVNDRFLLGPFIRYTHFVDTRSQDADFLAFGVQLDLVLARRRP